MAQRTILENINGECECEEYKEMEWVVAKALLDANAHTVRAFESHLLRTYREDATPDLRSMQSNLRQAIDEHEKIIEELEAAERVVTEMRREQAAETSDE